MTNNDETRVNFDKNIPLRDREGNLLGEALVTMRFGEIIISAQIDPLSTLGRELMRRQTPLYLDFKSHDSSSNDKLLSRGKTPPADGIEQ